MQEDSPTQQQRLLALLRPNVIYPPGLRERLQAGGKLLSFESSDGLYVIDSIERYVYHYTKSRTALKILNSGQLRMSPFVETNDPRENKDWIFSVHTRHPRGFAEVPVEETNEIMNKTATDVAKNRCKLACFTMDDEIAVPGGIGNSTIYARGFCHPRMWSQYGEAYSGVCLVFDRRDLHRAIEESLDPASTLFSGVVRYQNPPQAPRWINELTVDFDSVRVRGLEVTIREQIQRYWRELYFEKSEDWASEKEFRWLIWGEPKGPHLVPFGDSLKAIVVGHALDTRRFGRPLTEYCERNDVQIMGLGWQNGVPGPRPFRNQFLALP